MKFIILFPVILYTSIGVVSKAHNVFTLPKPKRYSGRVDHGIVKVGGHVQVPKSPPDLCKLLLQWYVIKNPTVAVLPKDLQSDKNISDTTQENLLRNVYSHLSNNLQEVNKKNSFLQNWNWPEIHVTPSLVSPEHFQENKDHHHFEKSITTPVNNAYYGILKLRRVDVPEPPQSLADNTGQSTARVDTPLANDVSTTQIQSYEPREKLNDMLDKFDRKLYTTTYTKLSENSPSGRQENGISFVTSSFFIHLMLSALTMRPTILDLNTTKEIVDVLGLPDHDDEKLKLIQSAVSMLPESNSELKLWWSTRLVLGAHISGRPNEDAIRTLKINVTQLTGQETPELLTKHLNNMVLQDSGGAMADTFDEEELATFPRGVLLSMLYVRAHWRVAPTLLNGSVPFRDVPSAPARTTRMIHVNDIMGYVHLKECDAEAIEIQYATEGLSFVLLVPRGNSLRALARYAGSVRLADITARMRNARVSASLPLYTLRMTLLLPNKLGNVGIKELFQMDANNLNVFKLSHAVQRLMFWSEAGRNAFKDDGLQWDEPPELKLVVDRPYIFFVRWRNVTIMNGNFVL